MARKDDRKGKDTETLGPEDADLWQRVARSAKPLTKGKNRAVRMPEPSTPRHDPPTRAKTETSPKRGVPRPAPAPAPPKPPSLGTIEKREIRGLAGGRVSVDARIDLHGARQLEAHRLLKGFLARAQERGHRYVLVITGKGSAGGGDPHALGRGVLNREVPRWLSEPDFRQWVVSFTPAHRRHGGEGALYVRIRRRKPA